MKANEFPQIERSVPLIDIERGGTDGRTVTAYAATFNNAYEVSDWDGDYDEEIDPKAFNRELGRGIEHVTVVFNHGMTLWGTPAERYAMPVGTPVEIKPDTRGLLTVTRYNNTPLADEVLELIDSGSVKYQSFRGPVYKTAPDSIRKGRLVKRRLEIGLKEYGPAPFPANDQAKVLAIRSQLLVEQIGEMTPDERRELAALLADDTLPDPSSSEPVGDGQSSTTDPPDPSSSEPVGQDDDHDDELLLLVNAQRQRRSTPPQETAP